MLSAFVANAQTLATPYFLENIPTRHFYNPAFQPQSNLYISIPVAGYMQMGVYNNSISLKNLVYKDANGNTVTAFSPQGRDKFYNRLRSQVLFSTNFETQLLGFGFRTEQAYWTFALNTKLDFDMTFPKTGLLLYGTGDKDNPRVADLKNLGIKSQLYTEAALGYSRQIDKQLTVGGKLKFLYGHGGIVTRNNRLDLITGIESWELDGDLNLLFAMPLSIYNEDENKFETGDVAVGDLFRPSGLGAGIDLGATYKLLDNLTLAASFTDLGFIRWTNNASHLHYATRYSFVGEEFDAFNLDNVGSVVDSIIGALENGFSSKAISSFSTGTTAKLNLSAEYSILDDKITFGLLSRTMFYKKTRQDFTLAANFRPVRAFNFTTSYSLINGRFSNIGLGMGARLGVLNLHIAADYLPFRYENIPYSAFNEESKGSSTIPYNTKGLNFSFGLNFVFGSKKNNNQDDVANNFDLQPNALIEVEKQLAGIR
jgi:hypothetical protein